MRLKKSVEEAISVLLFIASEYQEKPIKSNVISQRLGVSDSYLKKILRKLVIGDLVYSNVSKGGGFTLAKPISQITLLDIYYAIEGPESFFSTANLISRIFDSQQKCRSVESRLNRAVTEGEQLFLAALATHSLAQLVE